MRRRDGPTTNGASYLLSRYVHGYSIHCRSTPRLNVQEKRIRDVRERRTKKTHKTYRRSKASASLGYDGKKLYIGLSKDPMMMLRGFDPSPGARNDSLLDLGVSCAVLYLRPHLAPLMLPTRHQIDITQG